LSIYARPSAPHHACSARERCRGANLLYQPFAEAVWLPRGGHDVFFLRASFLGGIPMATVTFEPYIPIFSEEEYEHMLTLISISNQRRRIIEQLLASNPRDVTNILELEDLKKSLSDLFARSKVIKKQLKKLKKDATSKKKDKHSKKHKNNAKKAKKSKKSKKK
jgi:hypothetical protein